MRLPGLFILGGQKCGTTSLYASLVQHKSIYSAIDPLTNQPIKEVGYFSQCWDKGLDWYRSLYLFDTGVGIDATPNYLNNMTALRRIADLIPDAKLIVSLRDPVDRAFSQFNHYSQLGADATAWDWPCPGDTFAANIETELVNPAKPWNGLLARGRYSEQLELLYQLFPREQVHVMVMERWASDPIRHLAELIQFGELSPQDLCPHTRHVRTYTVDGLDEQMTELLSDYYRPLNDQLFELLGGEIQEWR